MGGRTHAQNTELIDKTRANMQQGRHLESLWTLFVLTFPKKSDLLSLTYVLEIIIEPPRASHNHLPCTTSHHPRQPLDSTPATDLPIHVDTVEEDLSGPERFARHSQLEGTQIPYFPPPLDCALRPRSLVVNSW